MDETQFDWDNLRLFLAVARGGGLAGAVATTGKSAPTLGRRMLQLERRLGQELFYRNARGYDLTEHGKTFLDKVVAVENGLLPAIKTDGATKLPLIKVSAGTWVTKVLCENLSSIIQNDALRLRFIAAEEILDIGRREAVVGIRNHRPGDPWLAGRKIGTVKFASYAQNRTCRPWIHVLGSTPSARWVERNSGADRTIEVTSPRNAIDLALTGAGRIVLPTFVGDTTAGLCRLADPIEELEHEQWQVMHHEDRYLPEVRNVIDRIFEVLVSVSSKE
ncbi:LysR family transcriptional regulator [uncultured Tateyamaria sp.]|uniref:LysR family transcriptional regulator n=1 Tax=uncultured Tateyamaria sp. TaxID=455651 RepID=UPI00262C3039|nr:LysR family transcriptional regulator [uncultured Tateyamaria sp.]